MLKPQAPRTEAPSTQSMASSREGVETCRTGKGLAFRRLLTKEGVHPFDTITWDNRSATLTNESGEVIFDQKNVEVPESWSQMATNVVVSKYFRGALGTPQREKSVKQMIGRVVNTIADWGTRDGYFDGDDSASAFRDELHYLSSPYTFRFLDMFQDQNLSHLISQISEVVCLYRFYRM